MLPLITFISILSFLGKLLVGYMICNIIAFISIEGSLSSIADEKSSTLTSEVVSEPGAVNVTALVVLALLLSFPFAVYMYSTLLISSYKKNRSEKKVKKKLKKQSIFTNRILTQVNKYPQSTSTEDIEDFLT